MDFQVIYSNPYQTLKEPRCLFPISLMGAESGLELHLYAMAASYYIRCYFSAVLLPMAMQFFIPAINCRVFKSQEFMIKA
jgi:hypothetical protein